MGSPFSQVARSRQTRRPSRFFVRDLNLEHNRYIGWLRQPVGWFATAAGVALLLGLGGEKEAFAVAGAMAGLVGLGIAWPAISVRCVSARLSWGRFRAEEGEQLNTELDVTNRWPWPIWGLIVEADDAIVNGGHDQTESVSLASVPAISKTRFAWEAVPQRRGEYPQKQTFLTSGFPFGLWTARRPLAIEQSLLVWPKTIELSNFPSILSHQWSTVGVHVDRGGSEGDVIGVRPYREGDSLRHVHWAQSARHDRLVVCERQSIARKMLQLEVWPESIDPLAPICDDVREWVLRVAGSLARTFLSQRWNVRFQLPGTSLVAEPGAIGLHRLLDGLARWDGRMKLKGAPPIRERAESVSLKLGVTSVAGFRQRSVIERDAIDRWVMIDRGSGHEHGLSSAKDPLMYLNVDQPVWPQLRQGWDAVCRDPLSLSTSEKRCLCEV